MLAQHLFPFSNVPLPQVPLAAAYLVILEHLRRAVTRYSWYDRDVPAALRRAVAHEFQAARWAGRRSGSMARLRILLPLRGLAPAPSRLP